MCVCGCSEESGLGGGNLKDGDHDISTVMSGHQSSVLKVFFIVTVPTHHVKNTFATVTFSKYILGIKFI